MDKFTNWLFPIILIIGLLWVSFQYGDWEMGMDWISAVSLMFIAMSLMYMTNKMDQKRK